MTPPDASPPPPRRRGIRRTAVAGIVALTIGLSGFFMGMRETSRSSAELRNAWDVEATSRADPTEEIETAATVVAYSELHEGSLRANRDWTNNLSNLETPAPDVAQFALLSEEEQVRVRLQRNSRRQYDGAPPISPHPLDQMSATTCLQCHGQPTVISGVTVPQMSHRLQQNCLQCHVSSAGPTSTWRTRPVSLAAGNGFTGKAQPGYGSRAYVGAPPVMPHTTWMRQSCISCHGPGGTSAFRTPHADRQNCLQCHAVNASLDQAPSLARFGDGIPPPLSGPSE